MSIHQGHRQRVKERFLADGLDQFNDIQALELLLFYCIPQQDTNPIAHALLERFGSFAGVLDADSSELMKVPGIKENAATFLSLLVQTGRYYQKSKQKDIKILTSVEQCGQYLIPYFHGLQNETVFILCLDAKCKVLCCKEVGEGSVNSAAVPIRRIVQIALSANATSVVLAHNHPSGLAIPSGEDVQTTMNLAAALDSVEIRLVDHIVVADEDFVSLAQSGLYKS